VHSAITRAQPIVLTGLAAMLGAFFILDDPIFNGLAISLIFGILVSTVLTLVVIPILYFVAYRHRPALAGPGHPRQPVFVSQWWLAFTAFVGANLLQSALTAGA
jgi:predicted RND superfamily exporter protein